MKVYVATGWNYSTNKPTGRIVAHTLEGVLEALGVKTEDSPQERPWLFTLRDGDVEWIVDVEPVRP